MSTRKLNKGRQAISNKKFYWIYKIKEQRYIYLNSSCCHLTFWSILPGRHFPGRVACPLIYSLNLISGQIMSCRTHPSRLSTGFNMCTGCLWLQSVMSIFLWNLSMVSEPQARPCRTCTINEIITLVVAADPSLTDISVSWVQSHSCKWQHDTVAVHSKNKKITLNFNEKKKVLALTLLQI